MIIKLGIIREGKKPVDRRVPFTPEQTLQIVEKFPSVQVVCQQSPVRCYSDAEYHAKGIPVVHDVSDCDILMGIKEVPVPELIEKKTYLFFSHTMKQQPYNKKLLQTVLEKKIRLVDYEVLRDTSGNRLVAFGRYAGIVGAYNGLWAYGKRYNLFTIRRPYECFDLEDLKTEFGKIKLPALKIALTGSGRVGRGAMEVLDGVGIQKVGVEDFLNKTFSFPVYAMLSSRDYHVHAKGHPFDRDEFHTHPERYVSDFVKFTQVADILIAGAYWNPNAPALFTQEDMTATAFRIKVIADISCDINGPIPATIQATNVDDPIYDYDPVSHTAKPPLSDEKYVTVMAIDNLPCELPRSASEDFGRDLIDRVLPALLQEDRDGIIERATIACDGKLTPEFQYLRAYAGITSS